MWPVQGSLQRGPRGNAVHFFAILPERTGTTFRLLKCLKRIIDGISNHFSARNALKCEIVHILLSKFSNMQITNIMKITNAYTKGKADVVYLQVTLCDPHLSA